MKNERGITLISLVITIIILLILAGVTILQLVGNGLLNKAQVSSEEYKRQAAKEKLELVISDLSIKKYSDSEYNENEYIDERLEEQKIQVNGDFVSVDGWEFEINRSVPEVISQGIKQENIENNESLIGKISKITESGNYEIKLNKKAEDGSIQEVKYSVDVITYKGNLVLDGTQEVEGSTIKSNVYEFGDNTIDVATADENAKNMVILKIDGNLTINEEITLTSCKSDDGYGGPKGMMIFCTGKITNKGTISMTARGAKAEGEDVYLWQNSDGSYEYVPAVGGKGGTKVGGYSCHENGQAGINGINRATRRRRLRWSSWE